MDGMDRILQKEAIGHLYTKKGQPIGIALRGMALTNLFLIIGDFDYATCTSRMLLLLWLLPLT